MLVNATEMLKKAKAEGYAVGQFNINNLEWTKAVLLTPRITGLLHSCAVRRMDFVHSRLLMLN